MTESAQGFLDGLGTSTEIQGLLAIIGLVTAFLAGVKLYKPKDIWERKERHNESLSGKETKNYLDEKALFSELQKKKNGKSILSRQSNLFLILSVFLVTSCWLILIPTYYIGVNLMYMALFGWSILIVVLMRHQRYLMRRERRFEEWLKDMEHPRNGREN